MTEWISREEWQRRLNRSRDLQSKVDWARREGREPKPSELAELVKLNRGIRDPRVMKVRGIDDNTGAIGGNV